MSMPTTTTRAAASRFDLEEKSRAVARDARRDSRRVGGEEAVRAAEARGDALRQRGDEVARENDQLRTQLEVAEEP